MRMIVNEDNDKKALGALRHTFQVLKISDEHLVSSCRDFLVYVLLMTSDLNESHFWIDRLTDVHANGWIDGQFKPIRSIEFRRNYRN